MPHRNSSTPGFRTVAGFSLIEVLVALLVLSVGLLGLALLQATGLKFNNDSYMRTQATILAYDLIDRMRANKVAADAGKYCTTSASPCVTTAAPTPEGCGDTTSGCGSAQQLAVYDVTSWYARQKDYLAPGASPSSIARTTVTTAGGQTVYQYTITMRWSERDTNIEQTWVVEL
jgi:type IV pilus assembly protein PilV